MHGRGKGFVKVEVIQHKAVRGPGYGVASVNPFLSSVVAGPSGISSVCWDDDLVTLHRSGGRAETVAMLRPAGLLRADAPIGSLCAQAMCSCGRTLVTLHGFIALAYTMPASVIDGGDDLPSWEKPTVLRPCAEARCLDITHVGQHCLVAFGGTFGLELQILPRSEDQLPQLVLCGSPVAVVKVFPPHGGEEATVAVACLTGRVGVWSLSQLREDASPPWTSLVVKSDRATSLAFSSMGTRLAVGSGNGQVFMLRKKQRGCDNSGHLWSESRAFLSIVLEPPGVKSHGSAASLIPSCGMFVAWGPADTVLAASIPGSFSIVLLDALSGRRLQSVVLREVAAGCVMSGLRGLAAVEEEGTMLCMDGAGALITMKWAVDPSDEWTGEKLVFAGESVRVIALRAMEESGQVMPGVTFEWYDDDGKERPPVASTVMAPFVAYADVAEMRPDLQRRDADSTPGAEAQRPVQAVPVTVVVGASAGLLGVIVFEVAHIWDVRSPAKEWKLLLGRVSDGVLAAAFAHDGRTLLAVSRNGSLVAASTSAVCECATSASGAAASPATPAASRKCTCPGLSGSLREVQLPEAHGCLQRRAVWAVTESEDGKKVGVVAVEADNVTVWRMRHSTHEDAYDLEPDGPVCIKVHPWIGATGGLHLSGISGDGRLLLWSQRDCDEHQTDDDGRTCSPAACVCDLKVKQWRLLECGMSLKALG